MHTLRVRQARPELRPFVRTFVQRNIGSTCQMVVEPTTAQLEQILAFDFGTPVEAWYPDGQLQVIDPASAAGAQTRFACHMHLRGGLSHSEYSFSRLASLFYSGFQFVNSPIVRVMQVRLLAVRFARCGISWAKAPPSSIGSYLPRSFLYTRLLAYELVPQLWPLRTTSSGTTER